MSAVPAEITQVPWTDPPILKVASVHDADTHWDEQSLRHWINANIPSEQVIVVSDRQPISHTRVNGALRASQPASGLVTAIEPILRACRGTWIAHGSGDADRDVVDESDAWRNTSEAGAYRLRRIWLTPDEERGYRHGFSNSGLWPLCHMVHVRPVFSEASWQHYEAVNARFADAIVSEARQPDPIVLIQDYHLALVPALLRARMPRATIVAFWHVPWTSSEQMSICPWLPALMKGLLGSDIVGFQTRQHRDNFSSTAERWKRRSDDEPDPAAHRTLVGDYPISVAWPSTEAAGRSRRAYGASASAHLLAQFPADAKLIVGIDRFDYTKGLLERLHAVEHLLENYPQWQGRLRFVQVAAPSGAALHEYSTFQAEVWAEVKRINARFATNSPEPITLLDEHHDRAAVDALYRAADLCLVTSLHDGMNLVAKEFVAAREDERGVLVLSEFAGAAEELSAALIVNPYHTVQVAQTIHRGLTMPAAEQGQRMRALRAVVKLRNVYRWAATLLSDVASLRRRRLSEWTLALAAA